MELIVIDDGTGGASRLDPADALIKQVDADVDQVFQEVIGNRTTEYNTAYSDALAYQTAGFTGTVPQSVQDWADIMQQTAQWAALNVLGTANAWNGAQAAMRKNRLATKQAARTAAGIEDVELAKLAWDTFLVATRKAFGI
ncbi:hypothetical protein [Undibacterium sp.]|uniref:hypothetical protein n=1 Tax=Undibacterium sp. TaxID=1914977 RepID=UPI00374C8CF3